jgi:hypothetical protein
MSASDRLLYTAAAIGLIAIVLLWGVIGVGVLVRGVERQHAQSYASDQGGTPQGQSVESISTAFAYETCAESEQPGEDEATQRSKEDLCAQFLNAAAASKMARLAFWQTVVGVGGLVAVAFTLALNAVATFAATDQAKTARRALEDLERPYLLAEIKQRPQGYNAVFREASGARPFDTSDTTEYRFRNHGRSPALLVKYNRARIGRWASQGSPPPIDPLTDSGFPAPHGVVVPVGKRSQKFEVVGEFWPADPNLRQGPQDNLVWWFMGYAVYRDMTGNTYALGFCHFYSAYHRGWFLRSAAADDDSYNYDHRIDPRRIVRMVRL